MDEAIQTEAQRLAAIHSDYSSFTIVETHQAQAELLRQHARIAELEAESARLRARKPMTDYQLRKIIEWLNKEYLDDAEGWGYGDFAKAIEAAHEIGGVNAD